jgi:hypothetical protein
MIRISGMPHPQEKSQSYDGNKVNHVRLRTWDRVL